MTTLKIHETFVSIQGEGSLVGTLSSFVRLTGCNLRCSWCDSPATSWMPIGESRTVDDLVGECLGGPRHVVVTGGEPLLQRPVLDLVRRLRAAGKHVTIETAGTVDLADLEVDLLSLSPKLSNSTPHNLRGLPSYDRHERLRSRTDVAKALMGRAKEWQLKFVVRPQHVREDVREVDMWLARTFHGGLDNPARVFLMPECTDPDALADAYAAIAPVCIERGLRLGERLHVHLDCR